MGSDVHSCTTGLMIYLKDEWGAKKGGELPDSYKCNIFGDMDGVLLQKNGFDFDIFVCMFADSLSRDCPLYFSQYEINNQERREIIVFSIFNGAEI